MIPGLRSVTKNYKGIRYPNYKSAVVLRYHQAQAQLCYDSVALRGDSESRLQAKLYATRHEV